MASVIIQTQPVSVSVVPGQDTTFSVVPSANFSATYSYQWRLGGVPIAGATSPSYFIDPLIGDNSKSFTVSVSALSAAPQLSATVAMATVVSNAAILTVTEPNYPFSVFEKGKETGVQRFRRLRHLGYV
jgi:hypothetical protein